ncbi:MAG TPA: hypothetical protein VNO51_25305 [Ilumatobacteraceae bacterium]|nr:hypothetical protein [Ilumatobacteraceae bacterium]
MTTLSNSIPTTSIASNSISATSNRVNRKRAIVVGVVLGVGAVAASVAHDGSASARHDDPAAVYADLAHITEWARAHGLGGLSPASLRPVAD